jgi:hypothetical protein
MSNVMEWDELNLLRSSVEDLIREYRRNSSDVRDGLVHRWCDYMEFVLCLIYLYGWRDAEEIVGIVPFEDGLDDKCVNRKIDGETFRERVVKQLNEDSEEGVIRIIDTEAHRDYNTAVYEAGTRSGKPGVRKRWNTMLDDRVRDAHSYLEGVVVGLNDYFYTYTGDSTLFPGGFGVPELDINCRCFVTLTA